MNRHQDRASQYNNVPNSFQLLLSNLRHWPILIETNVFAQMKDHYQPHEIISLLNDLGVSYTLHEHIAVFNCRESEQLAIAGNCGKTKNLFLHNRKRSHFYLVVVDPHSAVDLKHLADLLGDSKLSFASEADLQNILGISAGSVSLLALANDHQRLVQPLVDSTVWAAETIQCHPLRNDMTLEISKKDLEHFLTAIFHAPIVTPIPRRQSSPEN